MSASARRGPGETGSAVLLVANWDSGVGYAWWLMESYWVLLSEHYAPRERVLLTYPSITTMSAALAAAPVTPLVQSFGAGSVSPLLEQCRFLRRNRVRLMYLSDRGTWEWRYLIFRLCGVRKIIVHNHTPGQRTRPRGLKRWLKLCANRIPWLAADGAIGATDFVRERIVQVNGFPQAKTYSAPNGLPSRQGGRVVGHDPRRLFGIPADRSVLVMTGRANLYKNVDFVIECVAKVMANGRRGLHFLFIGDGPDLQYFRDHAEAHGVYEHCTFPGRREDVPALLRGCDFAMHPSRGEVGYSLSILEYMQAGLPVIVPDNPSVCAATEHEKTGLVYQEGDTASAVAAIERLLNDKAFRNEMGEMGARVVNERFCLERTHAALLNAFREIDPLPT